MNDLYVLVDHKEKLILAPTAELPKSWENISGLYLFEDGKLKDLSWAGHDGKGWVKVTDKSIETYEHADTWLEMSKFSIIDSFSEKRKEKENDFLTFKGHTITINEKTRTALVSKKLAAQENSSSTFVWKFDDASVELTSEEVIQLANFVEAYVQGCFDVEYEYQTLVNAAKNISDIASIDFTPNWPSNTYK